MKGVFIQEDAVVAAFGEVDGLAAALVERGKYDAMTALAMLHHFRSSLIRYVSAETGEKLVPRDTEVVAMAKARSKPKIGRAGR